MNIIEEKIDQYIHQHTTKENPVLQELNRETHLNVLLPQMLSGHVQGEFLSIVSKMLRPKRILEIGTYTGYSGICLAQGLEVDGILYTIDINEDLTEMVEKYIKKVSLENKIKPLVGNALDIIPTLNETFDLVFIDADKINYCNYYDLVIDKVRKGGIIIADNVLWSGKVVIESKTNDKDTIALREFNKKIHQDNRVSNLIVPLRDGLMMAIKL